MKSITTRAALMALAEELGVRPDWHAPSEQGITVTVRGADFDNAMPPGEWFGPADDEKHAETHVILYRYAHSSGPTENVFVGVVNLATLFAWATGFDDQSGTRVDWQGEFDDQRSRVNCELERHLAPDFSGGELDGIRKLAAERDEQTARAEELENQIADAHNLLKMIQDDPTVSRGVITKLRSYLGSRSTERLTEDEYRRKIANEIFTEAARLGDVDETFQSPGLARALQAIVSDVANRVLRPPTGGDTGGNAS